MLHFPGNLSRSAASTPELATILIGPDGVTVTSTRNQETARFTWQQLSLSLGGASGKMLFFRDAQSGVSFFSEAEGIRHAVQGAAPTHPDHAKLDRTDASTSSWTKFVVVALVSVVALVGGGVAMLPAVVAKGVDGVPESVDVQIGDAAIKAFLADDAHNVTSGPAKEAVDQIVQRLVSKLPRNGFEFSVHVVANSVPNAFALPGGEIVVFTGLLEKASRPEQVAGVLAHEIAHVTLRHGMRGLARSLGVTLALQFILGDVSGLFALAANGAVLTTMRSYSRDAETDADAAGVRLMRAAGLDPNGLAEFFEILKKEPATEMPGMLQWLSTHPEHDARIENVHRLAGPGPHPSNVFHRDWQKVRDQAKYESSMAGAGPFAQK